MKPVWKVLFGAAALVAASSAARAADHGDTPLLTNLGRHDAKISDLHVFTRGANLVLAVSTNTAVPPSASSYTFPSDLEIRIFVDNHSRVSFDDEAANLVYGGTVMRPAKIGADIEITVGFDDDGNPVVEHDGLAGRYRRKLRLYSGLRDDPFIRGPRQGRNVGAVVLELPLAAVVGEQPTLLVWTVTKIARVNGPFQDMAGRALRSMFPENDPMNTMPPKLHSSVLGVAPDVVIFDTSRPASFPNGRELADDVVDLVGDARVTSNDAPFPSTNDRPFLTGFPYLADPHPAP